MRYVGHTNRTTNPLKTYCGRIRRAADPLIPWRIGGLFLGGTSLFLINMIIKLVYSSLWFLLKVAGSSAVVGVVLFKKWFYFIFSKQTRYFILIIHFCAFSRLPTGLLNYFDRLEIAILGVNLSRWTEPRKALFLLLQSVHWCFWLCFRWMLWPLTLQRKVRLTQS